MKKLLLAFGSLAMLSACMGAPLPGGTRAWIDVPRDRSVISLTPHEIIAHASDAANLAQVELLINGVSQGALFCDNLAQPLVTCRAVWTPPAFGEYRLEARATNPNGGVGVSEPVTVQVGKLPSPAAQETPIALAPTATPAPPTNAPPPTQLPTVPVTAPPTQPPPTLAPPTLPPSVTPLPPTRLPTPTPIPPSPTLFVPSPIPPTVTPVPPTPEPTDTQPPPPPPPTATRTNTPKPTPDTEGPPPPQIVLPANDAELDCTADVKLMWLAPSDPSGIANYRVRLQKRVGSNYVDQKIWDPVTTTVLNANADTECGNWYRWRLFARDSAGNQGQVSDWAMFSLTLD